MTTSTFTKNMKKVEAAIKKNIAVGVFQAALLLQREAQLRCPVDTGALRASAYTRRREDEEEDDQIVYEVGFTQNYAVYVHENVGANFKVGQAKYLEEPARTIAPKLGAAVSAAIQSGKNIQGL